MTQIPFYFRAYAPQPGAGPGRAREEPEPGAWEEVKGKEEKQTWACTLWAVRSRSVWKWMVLQGWMRKLVVVGVVAVGSWPARVSHEVGAAAGGEW